MLFPKVFERRDAYTRDLEMFFLGNKGYRVIAHDRRGHGRSSQPWVGKGRDLIALLCCLALPLRYCAIHLGTFLTIIANQLLQDGNDMDTWTDDLLTLFEHLDLKDAMLVGHSTGGGEVTRFLGRHGSSRVSKAVLVGANPPCMLVKEDNPEGRNISWFDDLRAAVVANRAQTFLDIPTGPFFGYNLEGATPSQGLIQSWYQQAMLCSIKSCYDTIKTWQVDYTEDLKKIDIPVLVIHGELDQIVPIKAAAPLTVKALKKGTLKIYPGGAHALPNTQADDINADLLNFLES